MLFKFILLYLLIMNIAAFLLFGIDKWKAKRDAWRIPEKTLLGLAFIGGSLGALLAMKLFHHKVNMGRKPAFAIGIPIMLILQLMLIAYINYQLRT